METPQVASRNHVHPQHQATSSLSPPPLSPSSAAAGALANARWMPTKEQIAVLEELYRQGMRTPTAEQIQQITERLVEHGHIEGKNVFYWFQNHKARLNKKQKQQSFDYFSKLLRRPPPLPVLHRRPIASSAQHFSAVTPLTMLPPAPASNNGGGNVMYRQPCFMPPAQQANVNVAYYSHPQTQVLYPGMEVAHNKVAQQPPASMYQTASHGVHAVQVASADRGGGSAARETLQLFPLQPTFVLPEQKARRTGSAATLSTPAPSASASDSFSGESESSGSPNSVALPFYDFFGVHSGGR